MDKTGTMTEGVFKVQEVNIEPAFDPNMMLGYLNAIESKSTHPIATAVHEYVGQVDSTIALDNGKKAHILPCIRHNDDSINTLSHFARILNIKFIQ